MWWRLKLLRGVPGSWPSSPPPSLDALARRPCSRYIPGVTAQQPSLMTCWRWACATPSRCSCLCWIMLLHGSFRFEAIINPQQWSTQTPSSGQVNSRARRMPTWRMVGASWSGSTMWYCMTMAPSRLILSAALLHEKHSFSCWRFLQSSLLPLLALTCSRPSQHFTSTIKPASSPWSRAMVVVRPSTYWLLVSGCWLTLAGGIHTSHMWNRLWISAIPSVRVTFLVHSGAVAAGWTRKHSDPSKLLSVLADAIDHHGGDLLRLRKCLLELFPAIFSDWCSVLGWVVPGRSGLKPMAGTSFWYGSLIQPTPEEKRWLQLWSLSGAALSDVSCRI